MGESADLLQRWFEEVWNRGRADAIDELPSPKAIAHGLTAGELAGPPDVHIKVERTFEEGENVSAWCSATAIHRESGKATAFSGAVMGRVCEGRLQEGRNCWGFLGLLTQLGTVDTEAVAPLLGA